MQDFEFTVEFFKEKDGQEPIKNYIDELIMKAKTSKEDRIKVKKILAYIEALERWGTRAGEP